ncbi:uncharacterized protein BT62DRAFT_929636 [Guyanagaster necrorhizus]|uniref:Vacuolar sorting protein 39/Transforming growth factor beta receptor-associated domain-containing protein n=1 Tax=Guyanagaster necrorhizus TaxID=856835 RepID=A0A9P8AUS3_9AGAR|nr:uncharacterized protein BT62DRAFT_929636 [Guyanagaster necrorhizus MCA 3950]KAG7448550.1 hypothetical protein BT62DRAFT_929636 [Guyanagaster necrorhizus MCA 3950]
MPHPTSTFPRSGVLVLGEHAVHSLVPSTLISQAESLLDGHRISDAVDLADQQRKKLQSNISAGEDEAEELRYVYQRIGFQCFTETLFEDAGKNFFDGDLDPRLLISYYPDLHGSLYTSQDSIDVFAGVAEHMPIESSVDDIIRNYSPHLSPNTRTATTAVELRKILGMAAHEMLQVFLNKCRHRRKIEPEYANKWKDTFAAVDTVLVKLYAQLEKQELYSLLQETNHIVLDEIEPVLRNAGQYNALCMLYRKSNDHKKLLEVWAKLAEGEWTDEDITDPLSDMIMLLTEKKDRQLTQQWGIWLTKIDPERGLKLLTSQNTSKRREKLEDDSALLKQISEANPAAGSQYLEHLVLQKRNPSRVLHEQFATALVEQLLSYVSQDVVSKLWRAKASSFTSSRNESTISFFSYFVSTTPDSDHKRVRIKAALFLQGSTMYDFQSVRDKLAPYQKFLKLEMAIIEGKLGNHRAALSILIHDLNDSNSAEVYCALGGEVIPSKVALSAAENTAGLQLWISANWFTKPNNESIPIAAEEELKRSLLKILLEVYVTAQAPSRGRTARLLDSQAVNLDAVDVIPLVPPDWPLNTMSSFLTRSFRRTLHQRHEGQIIKTISAAQNLEVKEKTWLILREEGMVVEEPLEEEDDLDPGYVVDEKSALQVTLGPAADSGEGEKFLNGTHQRPWDDTVDIR